MFGDIFAFEGSAMKDRLGLIKKDPWRVPLGIMDEGGTKIWSTVLNKDMEPVVDYYGGTTKQNVANAKARGINTGPGEGMHHIARAITSMFAGGYGADKLGALGGAGGGGTSMPMDMSGDALGQASQRAPGAFGSGPAKAAGGGGTDWMQWARLGNNAMQNMQQPQTAQAAMAQQLSGDYYNPPQPQTPGYLPAAEHTDPKLKALAEALLQESPEDAMARLFGNVDPMSPEADAIRARASQAYQDRVWGAR